MSRRRLFLLLIACGLIAACAGPDDLARNRRYQAERMRFLVERNDIRFALESNPEIRAQFAASADAHEKVAALAKIEGNESADLVADLEELRAQALLRAGGAALSAGQFDRAVKFLTEAGQSPVEGLAIQAWTVLAWARGERDDASGAARAAGEMIGRMIGSSDSTVWTRERMDLLADTVSRLGDSSAGVDEVASWALRAREGLEAGRDRAASARTRTRAAWLIHRVSLATGDVEGGLRELERFAEWRSGTRDAVRARFARAELLATRGDDPDAALGDYNSVARQTLDPQVAGLARLRSYDLRWQTMPRAALADSLEQMTRDETLGDGLLAAAESRLALLEEQAQDWSRALQTYRRITLRFGSTAAGLAAPMRVLALTDSMRASGESHGRDRRQGLQQAISQYRNVLQLHPANSPVGMRARRYLIECLLEQGENEEALLEAEHLFHMVGTSRTGMRALLQAASIAANRLDRLEVARRCLQRVVRDWPQGREGVFAGQQLERLGRGLSVEDYQP